MPPLNNVVAAVIMASCALVGFPCPPVTAGAIALAPIADTAPPIAPYPAPEAPADRNGSQTWTRRGFAVRHHLHAVR